MTETPTIGVAERGEVYKQAEAFHGKRARGRRMWPWAWVAASVPFLLLFLLAFLAPAFNILRYAFGDGLTEWQRLLLQPTLADALGRTVVIALQTTLVCAMLGYVYAVALTRSKGAARGLLLAALAVPFLTSTLVRAYAWIILLGNTGPLNAVTQLVLDAPVRILYSRTAVLIGTVHILLPLFVLPLYAVLSQVPLQLERAARTLGAGRLQSFVKITLPLSLPGSAAGAVIVFITSLGFFVTPAVLGGRDDVMAAQVIQRELARFTDIGTAARLALALVLVALAVLTLFRVFYPLEQLFVQRYGMRRNADRRRRVLRAFRGMSSEPALRLSRRALRALDRLPLRGMTKALALVIAFYLVCPTLVVIPVSFSAEPFLRFPPRSYSLLWYGTVLNDELWRSAALNSLMVGLLSVMVVALVGIPLALVIIRSPFAERIKGLIILATTIPVIIPLVVLALGEYITFLDAGLLGNMAALSAVHALLGLPYFTLIMVAALRDSDIRIELAARSMGATKLQTLRLITLPISRQALVSGLMLAFLVSLDELLIAQAVLYRGNATLPIRLWEGTQEQISPALAVVSTLSLALTLFSALALNRLQRSNAASKGDT